MTLGQRIAERAERATLEELARGEVLAPDDAPLGPGDAERAADAIERALARKNQFAASEPETPRAIRRVVGAIFAALESGAPRAEAMTRGAGELREALRRALGDAPREVPAAAYSPELQLAVLGLRIDALREPILDVGCGEGAALVRALRDAGKDAHGIDRWMDPPTDWLTYDYGTSRWGTIVSHLGFSLHFMHQEMKSSDLAFEYARAYMRIVRSLAPGGTFAYVPGLPFIEAMLPAAELRVVRIPLARELVTESVARVQSATGLVLDASTHVIARP